MKEEFIYCEDCVDEADKGYAEAEYFYELTLGPSDDIKVIALCGFHDEEYARREEGNKTRPGYHCISKKEYLVAKVLES